MVYFGPSRGCNTCRKRRKKCDETRPSCLRCINLKRTCSGYQDSKEIIFRQYEGQDGQALPYRSMARKCNLPVRTTLPGTDDLPADDKPLEASDKMIEDYSLRAFIYDYCIVSVNKGVSRGYLSGLEPMILRCGPDSDLVKACKAVGFANHGIKLRRPSLVRQGEMIYHKLLGSLARSIEDPLFAYNSELLMIAVVLGLYEMIVAGDTNPGNHGAHAKGVAAFLRIPSEPLDPFGAVQFIRSSNHPLVSNGASTKPGLFFLPHIPNLTNNFDELLSLFGPIWRKSEALQSSIVTEPAELEALKEEAVALNQAFTLWQDSQNQDFAPRVVGHVLSQGETGSSLRMGYWPGNVHAYTDLYAATVWNISRAARLFLITIIITISDKLGKNDECTTEQKDASRLAEDMAASIPYHLTESLHQFLQDVQIETSAIVPGRPAGGLLLMHPIYIALKLQIVPLAMRDYFRECLSWITTYMGIGQASYFAKSSEVDKQYFADGCLIIWAGMIT